MPTAAEARKQGHSYATCYRRDAAQPDPGDWLMFRRTYDGQSYSPLDKINKDNVKNLELVWSWGIEKGASPNVDDWVGPIVHDGVMYLSMPGGIVHALDAANGDFLWQYRHQMVKGISPGATGGIRGGAVLYEDKVFIHAADSKIDAINAKTARKHSRARFTISGQSQSFIGHRSGHRWKIIPA